MIARNANEAYLYARRKMRRLRNAFVRCARIDDASALALLDEARLLHADLIGWASRN